MFFATEDGAFSYETEEDVVIFDVGKLAAFDAINKNYTTGSYLVCNHKRFNAELNA